MLVLLSYISTLHAVFDMSALTIYALICRNLLEFNSLDDPNSELWEETVRKLRRLRHVVQCRVCKAVAKNPYGTIGCNHVTCGDCKDTKKYQFSSCRSCKNAALLKLDKQTEVVLKCYAKVCEILQNYHNSARQSRRTDRIEKIWDLVSEGACLFPKQDARIGIDQKKCSDTFSSRLPAPIATIDNRIRESDVDHVLYENKFSQDGGCFQDGKHIQDGSRRGCRLQAHSEKGTDEIDENMPTEKQNGLLVELNIEKGSSLEVNGHSSKINTREAVLVGKKKQPENIELNLSCSNDNVCPREELLTKDHHSGVGQDSGEEINGYSLKQQLNNCDQNGIPSRKNGKRKLSPFRPSVREITSSRLREGKIAKLDGNLKAQDQKSIKEDELTGQEDNEPSCGKSSQHRKTSKMYHRNENRSVYKQKRLYAQDQDQISGKKSRNNIGHRQYTFIRKNKYKCACGSASGLKHFSDICNHRRCVCYAAGVPCVSCKCRFCSNPHKSNYSMKWPPVGIGNDMKPVKIEQTVEDGV